MKRADCHLRGKCACPNGTVAAPRAGHEATGHQNAGGVRLTLSRLVRAWLLESGEPLKAVAGRLGVGTSTISQWASQTRFPRPEELDALATVVGVPMPCLFCDALADSFERSTARKATLKRDGGLRNTFTKRDK